MRVHPPEPALAAVVADLDGRLRGQQIVDVEPPVETGHAAGIVRVDPATPDDLRAIIVPPAYIESAGRALTVLGLAAPGGTP